MRKQTFKSKEQKSKSDYKQAYEALKNTPVATKRKVILKMRVCGCGCGCDDVDVERTVDFDSDLQTGDWIKTSELLPGDKY